PTRHLERHPELGGHQGYGMSYFCTSSEKGRAYVRECTRQIFAGAPGLGGLINICFGEHPTHCNCSFAGALTGNCPRCTELGAEAAVANMLTAFAEGMHEVDPLAECIAWFYVPIMWDIGGIPIEDQKAFMRRVMAQAPQGVICQYNFESNGELMQQGKKRVALDYWLAWPGPSEIFEDCARNAVGAGARMSAKIQVGCSHEVATVPFVSVPGNLYKKYRAMHELGVSSVMQCWYFGNYPGLMNKAAGELAFAPFCDTEDAFLTHLAEPMWGRHAPTAVKAWKLFADGYSQFPVVLPFTWFGPVHDSIVWPLHLFPVDQPIAPSWLLSNFNSGDRIGECICYEHTLAEAVELLEAMAEKWGAGVALLEGLAGDFVDNDERLRDISAAKAMGIQTASARNVFQFYQLREQLPYSTQPEQRQMVEKMKWIVTEETANGHVLKALCEADSRLGFHSEAEGYKYFPAKIAWRIELLEALQAEDFPRLDRQISTGEELFPEYTGKAPTGPAYSCPESPECAEWQQLSGLPETNWRAYHSETSVTFEVECLAPVEGDWVTVEIEPRRLWPAQTFMLYRSGATQHINKGPEQDRSWQGQGVDSNGSWIATIEIPIDVLKRDAFDRPMRINILRRSACLVEKHPLPPRLLFGDSNSADLAWLRFV
ncbi:MAG: hypothetical protein HON70_27900, partial [Lentisphaerae bacterium]|nr:hypothetical protein [Lentisphaerota bacterium]